MRLRLLPSRESQWFALACALLTVFSLVLVFRYPALPLSDEAVVAYSGVVLHSLRTGDGAFAPWHGLRPGTPSHSFFYFIDHALLYVAGPAGAMKLLIALSILGLPLGLFVLLRAMGRSTWLSLGGFGLGFNALLAGGYVPFTLGMPLWLFSLAFVERDARAPARKNLLALFAVLAATPLFHFLLAPLAFLSAFTLSLLAPMPRRRRLTQLGVMFAAGLVTLAITLPSTTATEAPKSYAAAVLGEPLSSRVAQFPSLMLGFTQNGLDALSAPLLAVAVLATLVLAAGRVPPASRVAEHRLELLALGLFVLYLIAPWHLTWPWTTWGTAARIPPLFGLTLLGVSRFVPQRPREILRVLPPALFSLAHLAALTTPFFAFGREVSPVLPIAARLEPGSAVLSLALNERRLQGTSEFGDYLHHATRHVAKWPATLARAYQPESFCSAGYHPISCEKTLSVVDPRRATPEALAPWDAVVVYENGPEAERAIVAKRLGAAGFTEVYREGAWALWKSGRSAR